MSDSKSPSAQARDDLRLLIVCDTQFGWNGGTTLKLEEIERLVAREWLAEGKDNFEYEVTDAGRAAIDSALTPAPQVPEGVVLVPREPTPEMVEVICDRHAGKSVWPDDYGHPARAIRRHQAREGYRAMLAVAALNQPFGKPEELPLNEPSGDSGQLGALEQRPSPRWRPMETCPVDTKVLLWNDDTQEISIGHMPSDAPRPDCVVVARTASYADAWHPLPAEPEVAAEDSDHV
ncbi:hypothetical protein [Pseudoxanthomonas sp. PXM04]|uniref:hypothetical protein n=1 Tax=Pseudoxanthomonas sp. PXM04 TaxID=2769297 RepID=UPI001780ECF0|nr:hypothetical protein [Pseudoxanthomonas sp. PXM04]MBD9376156.1 hypothetical protein [Pseudoxanthomonas sp. PXM04]